MSKYINLTGETFGRLLVLHRNGSNRSGDAMFLCRCDCGTLTVVRGKHLRSGNTTSCGCYKAEQDVLRQADQIVDMSDQSFGNWYVLGRAENRKNTRQGLLGMYLHCMPDTAAGVLRAGTARRKIWVMWLRREKQAGRIMR